MIEAKGKFVVGVDGVVDFTVRPLTVGAAMDALEAAVVEHGDDVSLMRVRLFEYARMVTLGSLPMTVEQLLALTSQDYDVLRQVAGELSKKLTAPTLDKTPKAKSLTPEAS